MILKKKIKIELSQQSIREAINQLEAYKNGLAFKMEEFIRALAEVGFSVVEQNMSTEGDSSTEHNTYVRINSYGSYVKADLVLQGRDVLFIEFGAGIHYNGSVGSAAYDKAAEFGYTIGSYGKGHGAEDFWWYTDESGAPHMSQGTKAATPMYKASLKMRNDFLSVARRVFGG